MVTEVFPRSSHNYDPGEAKDVEASARVATAQLATTAAVLGEVEPPPPFKISLCGVDLSKLWEER